MNVLLEQKIFVLLVNFIRNCKFGRFIYQQMLSRKEYGALKFEENINSEATIYHGKQYSRRALDRQHFERQKLLFRALLSTGIPLE